MHQFTTPSLSQTIWPRWPSRLFFTLPILQTMLPVTFAYSLSSEAVVMRQLRRWKRLWRRSLIRSHKHGWQYGPGLKYHGTVTEWCTGREWPVNCMTVISAWWRSNMLFQRRWKYIFRLPVMGIYWVGLNYYITEFNQLETRCGRESRHPTEETIWTTDWAVWRPDQLVTRCGRESQHPAESLVPGPPVEQPRRTGKKCWWP